MSNWSKSLIIIPASLLLKTTSNKMSLIALKRTIRARLNLIDPLTSDQTNTWGTRHKIPRASPLKSRKSPQPSCATIPDGEWYHNKKLAQKEQ
jgi:hypothetical protein